MKKIRSFPSLRKGEKEFLLSKLNVRCFTGGGPAAASAVEGVGEGVEVGIHCIHNILYRFTSNYFLGIKSVTRIMTFIFGSP
jgi:hypothetical protein